MSKTKAIFAVLFALCAGNVAYARITGTNPTGGAADVNCNGKSGLEVCQTSSAAIIPTTTGVGDLGSSSFRWNAVYATTANFSGAVTFAGNEAIGGNLTVAGNSSLGATSTNTVISSGAVSINGGTPANGTLVVKSTSATGANPIARFADTASQSVLKVLQSGSVYLGDTANTNGILNTDDSLFINIDANANQTSNAIEIGRDRSIGSGGTVIMRVQENGLAGMNDDSPDALWDILAPNASSSGTVVTAATSQTADLLSLRDSSETGLVRVSGDGQLVPWVRAKANINTLVPAGLGAIVICSDCAIPYSVCTATGTGARQFARAGSATVGCGTDN